MSLRDRRKKETRAMLLAEAHARFTVKGFEQTTIEELCEAVGVSKRTFFRYFPTKEDLVFPNHEERLNRFLLFLSSAPEGESAFDTLRRVSQVFAQEYTAHRERFIGQQKLIHTSPVLMAKENAIDRQWERVMAQWFSRKLGHDGEEPDLFAKVLAGAAIGVIRATMRHWFDHEGKVDLEGLGLAAIDRLERGFRRISE